MSSRERVVRFYSREYEEQCRILKESFSNELARIATEINVLRPDRRTRLRGVPPKTKILERRQFLVKWLRAHAAQHVVECLCRRIPGIEDFDTHSFHDEVVYFVASGDLIKIGTSTDFDQRLAGLRAHSAIEVVPLVMVTGGRSLERALHEHFKDLRHHYEWFSPGKSLLDLIDNLRAQIDE